MGEQTYSLVTLVGEFLGQYFTMIISHLSKCLCNQKILEQNAHKKVNHYSPGTNCSIVGLLFGLENSDPKSVNHVSCKFGSSYLRYSLLKLPCSLMGG